MIQLLCALALLQDGELLRNPGFDEAAGDLPAEWRAVAPAEFQKAVEFAGDAKQARSGRSARIRNTNPANRQLNSFTHVVAREHLSDVRGKTVELTGWVRTYQADSIDLWIQCLDEAEQEVALFRARKYGSIWGTTDWTRHVASGVVPAQTRTLLVRCVLRGIGEAWFDELSLRIAKVQPAAADPPLVPDEHRRFREAASKFVLTGDREAMRPFAPWKPSEVEAALAGGLGPAPWASGYKTFSFKAAGRDWSYDVWIPAEARRSARPLLVDTSLAKDGHRAWVGRGAKDIFVLRPDLGDAPAREGEFEYAPVYAALLRDACARLPVDPDRVYVTGFAAWMVACVRADRVAAAAPIAEWPGGWLRLVPNLAGMGLFVSHGDADKIAPVAMTRRAVEALKQAGVEHVYREHAEAGHEDLALDAGNALEWMAARRRQAFPKRVSARLLGPDGVHWLEATKLAEEKAPKWKADEGYGAVASLAGEIADNVITITCENVAALRIWLNPRLVNFVQPVKVVVNGKVAHEGKIAPSFGAFLDRLAATGDSGEPAWAMLEVRVQ